MEKEYCNFRLEDFLLDDDFLRIVKSHFKGEDPEVWEQLLQHYPERKVVLEKAYQIINGIRIKEIQVEEKQIQRDWGLLVGKIGQRKNRRLFFWISSSAACVILILAGYCFSRIFSETTTGNKQALLNMLTETEVKSDDIQLILGKDRETSITENATIREKDDGSLTINHDTRIEADEAIDYIQLIVPKGKRSYLELKDGSRIWVNSGTKLLYPSRFNGKKREIYVNGEIYLEVASGSSSPFFVHTPSLDVKVLGTSFNVSAYSDDSFTEVVLVKGGVEVEASNNVTRLTPNTCYHLEDSREQVKPVDVYSYICWKDGIMRMNGEELRDIFKRLSRYYNVNIIAPAELELVHYFGKLGLEDDIERVLYNISLVEPIVFERDSNLIRIYPNRK